MASVSLSQTKDINLNDRNQMQNDTRMKRSLAFPFIHGSRSCNKFRFITCNLYYYCKLMGKASDRFHSRYHFAFDYGHSNWYHCFLFGKERHWPRSTLPNYGFWLNIISFLINAKYSSASLVRGFWDEEFFAKKPRTTEVPRTREVHLFWAHV